MYAVLCIVGCRERSTALRSHDARSSSAALASKGDADVDHYDQFLDATACEAEPGRLPIQLTLERELAVVFEGKSLRSQFSRIRVSADLARSILEAKEKVEITENALGAATDEIVFSAGLCGQFEDSVKTLVEVFRRNGDPSADPLALVIRCWWNTTSSQLRLARLDAEVNKLKARRTEIRSTSTDDPRIAAINTVEDKYARFQTALAEIRPAHDAYASSWRDLAIVFDKAAAQSGMKLSDRKTLSVTFSRMPQIEQLSRQLEQANSHLRHLAESRQFGPWGMCRNVAFSFAPSTTEALDEGGITALKEQWDKRALAIRSLIDRALNLPGTGR